MCMFQLPVVGLLSLHQVPSVSSVDTSLQVHFIRSRSNLVDYHDFLPPFLPVDWKGRHAHCVTRT